MTFNSVVLRRQFFFCSAICNLWLCSEKNFNTVSKFLSSFLLPLVQTSFSLPSIFIHRKGIKWTVNWKSVKFLHEIPCPFCRLSCWVLNASSHAKATSINYCSFIMSLSSGCNMAHGNVTTRGIFLWLVSKMLCLVVNGNFEEFVFGYSSILVNLITICRNVTKWKCLIFKVWFRFHTITFFVQFVLQMNLINT